MLKINEIFGPTVQGEGRSLGKPVLFLRLTNCNLHCGFCDTKHTWDWSQYDQKKETHEQSCDEVFDQIHNLAYFNRPAMDPVKALVISGGEPMLQQKQIIPLLLKLRHYGYWVEVETNGTVRSNEEFLNLVDQINCSPKLSNCGDPKKLRVRKEALTPLSASPKTNFKFVVSSEEDLVEVEEYIKDFSIKPEQVYLMPLGKTREELELTTKATEELAKKFGFNFTPRLHIVLFGSKRGV